MCLIFTALNAHPQYPVIICANRDEFYARAAKTAAFWSSSNTSANILAGKDLQDNGTWLAVNKKGLFAAITNYREIDERHYHRSRGELALMFLKSQNRQEFTQFLEENASEYAGFNCIYGYLSANPTLYYWSNRDAAPKTLEHGIHGLSNAHLNTDWFKVTEGKKAFASLLQQSITSESAFNLMSDQTLCAIDQLPNTGLSQSKELLLSSRFIHAENYGTRCTTWITVDNNGTLNFSERTYTETAKAAATCTFNFQIH